MNGTTMRDKCVTGEFAFSSSRNMIRDKTRIAAAAAGKVIKAVEYFRCRKMSPITTIKTRRMRRVSISDAVGEREK